MRAVDLSEMLSNVSCQGALPRKKGTEGRGDAPDKQAAGETLTRTFERLLNGNLLLIEGRESLLVG